MTEFKHGQAVWIKAIIQNNDSSDDHLMGWDKELPPDPNKVVVVIEGPSFEQIDSDAYIIDKSQIYAYEDEPESS